MINPKIVRNYASCLFDNIKSDKDHDLVLKQLSLFNDLMFSSKILHFVLCAPVVDRSHKLNLIKLIAKKCSFEKIVTQFFEIVAKNARFNILSEIVKEYKKLLMENLGIKMVTVDFAHTPDKKELKLIKQYLEKKLQKIVEFDLQSNKDLIGGVVIKYDSMIYDYSVLGAINAAEKLAKEVVM